MPHLSVAENIFLGKTPTRWAGVVDLGRMRAGARRILDGLGVAIDCDAPVHSLRLAQQQMVEVARALSDDARLLVMDEPTSALSQREVGELFATITRLTSSGVAVVYISHRMDEVFRIGHRVTVLRDGRHVATRNIADVTAAELVRLMANREVAEHYPRRQHSTGEELLRVDRLHGGGLEDISFVLHRGEILGIAGLVGAGRSRLARALVGADPVAERRIAMRGKPIAIDSPMAAARAGIGFLPEDRKQQGLVLRLSVERNMSLSHLGALARFGVLNRAEGAQRSRGLHRQPAHPDTRARSAGGEPERRQSAEGRAGEVAGRTRGGPDLRRADQGHRRRRQAGDLPADEPAGRERRRLSS